MIYSKTSHEGGKGISMAFFMKIKTILSEIMKKMNKIGKKEVRKHKGMKRFYKK